MLRLKFLDRICQQDEDNGLFWKKNAKKAFPALRSVHEGEEEARCTARAECSFYRVCRLALKDFTRVKEGLFDTRLVSSKALYRALVGRALKILLGMRSVWRRRSLILCGIERPGGGVSITMVLRNISGSANGSVQRGWQLHQNACIAVGSWVLEAHLLPL